MELHVTLAGRGELALQIYRQLRAAIVDGRLRPGEQLPPTRELAQRLEVSRNTVSEAYDRLTGEGFLVGRVGAGTFVSNDPIALEPRRAPSSPMIRPRAIWKKLERAVDGDPTPAAFDFRAGAPDARLFPIDQWRRLVARELKSSAIKSSRYGDPAGPVRVRDAIARHIGVSRSVRASADDVLVTHGAQQALDLISRVLIEPGTHVAVEEPGYPPIRALFESFGANVASVPVDEQGLVVSAIPKTARMIYVTPSHQFPLGVAMSLERRVALLAWAEQRGALVIEDDYDSELRFEGRPLEPLQSLDRSGRVLYVGTFSKVMLPILRLGFLVAPASLYSALRAAKRLADWHGELPAQAALARFLDEGLLARHIRKMTREYRARRDRLVLAVEKYLADHVELLPAAAGLHVTVLLKKQSRSLDLDRIVRSARDAGVGLQTLSHFCAEPPKRGGLVLGFGVISTSKIDEGIARLAECFPRLRTKI